MQKLHKSVSSRASRRKCIRKIVSAGLALSSLGGLGVVAGIAALPAHAQSGSFPDIPANHWAYQAVSDLAAKGYVKGYPDGDFLGQRALTRYEFATVLARMLATINDLTTKVNTPAPPQTPTGNFATVDDLNKLQALVDEFKKELDEIKADTSKLQSQLDDLRKQIGEAKAAAAKAQATADSSYGFGANRKFMIGGYIQARYAMADSSDKTRFPQGIAAQLGSNAYNGNYAQGGTKESFYLRRARLRITGQVTDNTKYGIQLDFVGNTAAANSATNVTVREGNVAYTFGNGDMARYPTVTVGLFGNYYGYMLGASPADLLTPERPLGFNEGPNGLFASQDYERGAQISYGFGKTGFRVTGGVVNGTGLNGNDNNDHLDGIYKLAYLTSNKAFGVGASYDDGEIARPAAGTTTFTGPNYQSGKKQLYDFDAHYNTSFGLFVLGEYLGGKYEQRSFFSSASALTTTTEFVPGNKIEAYYAQGGWTFGGKGSHPLTLGVSYDVFNRSQSGVSDSGSDYEDQNLGYGILYNLDKQTRLRIWYNKPDKVAHAFDEDTPPKIGLLTTEVQVRF